MELKLLSCTAARPDRRAITKTLQEIADGVDASLAAELSDILLEGSPVEIIISNNTSSGMRALRKLDIDYEIVE